MEMLPFKNPLGRPLKLKPEQLAEEFSAYVKWCEENPIVAKTRVDYANGGYSVTTDDHPRRISVDGFLVYLGCSDRWWRQLSEGKRGDEFSRVKSGIKKYCETYQVEMASAGLLKENIISRLLGLADKKEIKTDGAVPIIVRSAEDKAKLETIGEMGV